MVAKTKKSQLMKEQFLQLSKRYIYGISGIIIFLFIISLMVSGKGTDIFLRAVELTIIVIGLSGGILILWGVLLLIIEKHYRKSILGGLLKVIAGLFIPTIIAIILLSNLH